MSLKKFYIGSSGDTEIRLKKHLSNHKGFTGKAKDWTEYLKEEYDLKSVALKRERQLKGWKSKDRTWRFIERCHIELFWSRNDKDDTISSVG